MEDYGFMPGKYPAVVADYDQVTRTCKVSIPGITDGGDTLLIAEILYPLGDKSLISEGKISSEIEILVGDLIWVEFIGGDPRYPLIVGYRNPNTGNSANWRRWHHANIESVANGVMLHTAGDKILLTVGGSSIEITPSGIKLTAPRIDLN